MGVLSAEHHMVAPRSVGEVGKSVPGTVPGTQWSSALASVFPLSEFEWAELSQKHQSLFFIVATESTGDASTLLSGETGKTALGVPPCLGLNAHPSITGSKIKEGFSGG